MKHPLGITLLLIFMFITAQIIGLGIVSSYKNYFSKEAELKNVTVRAPVIKNIVPEQREIKTTRETTNIILTISIAFLIATFILLALIKFKKKNLIRFWFTLVVFIALSVSFSLLLYPLIGKYIISRLNAAEVVAIFLALILTFFKIKGNFFVHNLTELFIYGGIAAIFIPIMNIWVAAILLIGISIYDIIAVRKTKHMQKMAKFSIEKAKVFPGIFIWARERIKFKKENKKKIKLDVKSAILGGGDIAFPLIFSSIVFMSLGVTRALITVIGSTLGLAFLLLISERKFYPAMPFISAGCFLGYTFSFLI